MSRLPPYAEQIDGEWVRPSHKGFRMMCCSCSLVHKVNFRIGEGGAVEYQMFRDERATGAARRAHNLAGVKKAIDKAAIA